jgi:hypothetical protein
VAACFASRARDLFEQPLALALLIPFRDVGNLRSLGDRGEEFVGDVAGSLLPLVAVEELDEVPAAALFARGERGGAGRHRLLADDREVAEVELGFALRTGPLTILGITSSE